MKNKSVVKRYLLVLLLLPIIASCDINIASSISSKSGHNDTSLSSNETPSTSSLPSTIFSSDSLSSKKSSASVHVHSYDEPTFSWNEDSSACSVSFRCNTCEHNEIANAFVSSEIIVEATCEEEGTMKYTASISFNGIEYEDIKEEVIPALGHDYSEWYIVKENNEHQDGLRERECSRCHDKQEEVIPTTSPFTYALNKDNVSYTLRHYQPICEGEDILIPDYFNDLPITNIKLTISTSKDCVPNIHIPNRKITIEQISCTDKYYYDKSVEWENTALSGIIFGKMNLLFDGDISDWINNVSIKSYETFYHSYVHLYFFDEETSSYKIVDKLVIPEGLEIVKELAFCGISFKELVFPSSLKEVKSNAFSSNMELEKIELNEGLKKIANYAISGPYVKALTIPSTYIGEKYALKGFCVEEVIVNEGAQNINIDLFDTRRLVKVINNSDSDFFGTGTHNVLITKENADNCAIFEYQGLRFASVMEELYLLSTTPSYKPEVMRLPEVVHYQEKTFDFYSIRSNAFSGSAPMGGINWPTNEQFLDFYGGLSKMKSAKTGYAVDDLFEEFYIPKAVKAIAPDAINGLRFLNSVYFDGSEEEFNAVFDSETKKQQFTSTNPNLVFFARNTNGEYVPL